MSKVPGWQVQLVRMIQVGATEEEQKFAKDGFRALFSHPPTIQQLDGYIGALLAVLTVTKGGHISNPALSAVALMLGIGMDEVTAKIEKLKEEQPDALHVFRRQGDEAGTAGNAVRPDSG